MTDPLPLSAKYPKRTSILKEVAILQPDEELEEPNIMKAIDLVNRNKISQYLPVMVERGANDQGGAMQCSGV